MTLLQVRKLTKSFGGVVAAKEVDCEIRAGEIVGLIGPNGAGKTTFFNLITGFLPPTGGEIHFDGRNITGLPANQSANLGIVRTFQHTSLFLKLTVLENVMTGFHRHRKAGILDSFFHSRKYREEERILREKAEKILSLLGLSDVSDTLASNLPYGKQRMLGIGIALATEPKLIMLDEPAAGLIPSESKELMGIIRRIRDQGVSVLIVEHDMKLVMEICDRIVVLNSGEKIAEGTPKEIRQNPEVIRVYLGDDRHVKS